MKYIRQCLAALLLCAAGTFLSQLVLAQPPANVVPDEVLVGVKAAGDDVAEAPRLAYGVGRALGHLRDLHIYRLKLRPGLSIAQAAAQLSRRPEVLYVEPNGYYHATATPNDTYYARQWAPRKTQTDLAWGLWRPQRRAVVAIVDTGIDYTHPDLKNKVARTSTGTVLGYNAVGSNARSGVSTDAIDDQGHGTHVAGIAAAQVDNAVGVAGVSGWNGVAGVTDVSYTAVMPVKVLDSTGAGTDATVAAGINWAANNGAAVINLSLGGGGSTTLQTAVQYAQSKGCLVVAAAGNSGTSALSYPAAYSGVVSVAATDSSDTLAAYSNYGSWVVVAAPGSSIYSTLPTYAAGGNFGTNYGTLSGTSMATPHVAGEAALVWAQNPALTASQVRSLIVSNVDPYTPYGGHALGTGAGRINVYRALAAAGNPALPAVPTGLRATAGNGQVSLAWSASAGASSYRVKRATTSGGPYSVIASGVTTTTYTNTLLTNGATYYYVVSAVNSAGESANSAQVAATPQATTPRQLLGNPGFENGASTPAPWVASAGVIDNSTGAPAHSGSWKAWLCGYGTAHTDTLYQTVTIPSTATSASLTFWLWIATSETTTSAVYDTLRLQVRDTAGQVLSTLATYSNLNRTSGYVQKSLSLLPYRGRTVQVHLIGTEDSAAQTSFLVDDFALTVQ